MASEIIKELENNVKTMSFLVGNQKFMVRDAEEFLSRYVNILRKMEDLEKSRDKWRHKYHKLREESKEWMR